MKAPQRLHERLHGLLCTVGIIVLVLVTIATYYPSLHYDFVFDDTANITQLYNIRNYTFSELFCSGTRWISYWLNSIYYQIDKFNPFPYRCGNLIIHVLNGLLLFLLLCQCLSRSAYSFFKQQATMLAWLTATLFLLHPVQTQTVSYIIQGQLEGTSSLCILLLANCLFWYYETPHQMVKFLLLAFMALIAFFATGTKEIAIVTPAMLWLVDWFFIAQGSVQKIKEHMLVHGLLGTIIAGMYLYFLRPSFFIKLFSLQHVAKNNLGNIITADTFDAIKPYQYCISQSKVLLHYIWMFIWPFNISVEYDWKLVESFFSADCLIPLSILGFIGWFILKKLRQFPCNPLCFGALWFFVMMLPRSTIIPSCELVMDYKTYLASAGWFLIIATGLLYLGHVIVNNIIALTKQSRYKSLAQGAALLVLLSSLSHTTINRNCVWRSPLEFWANMLANAPDKARVQNNYAVELTQLGRFEESIPYYKRAIQLDPLYRDPYNNLAVAYGSTNQVDLAIQTLIRALKIYPYYTEAYNNIGSFFIEKHDYAHATEAFDRAIALNPTYGKAYYNKARLLAMQDDYEGACELFKAACMQADLDNEMGFSAFARASMEISKFDDAIIGWAKTVELNPGNISAWFNLGTCYHLIADYDKAIAVFEHMVAQQQISPRIWYNLGEAYFMAQRYENALNCFEQVPVSVQQMPQLHLRKAACYAELNNNEMSKHYVQSILAQHTIPDEIKQEAKRLLKQYNVC